MKVIGSSRPRYGNVMERPTAPVYKASEQDFRSGTVMDLGGIGRGGDIPGNIYNVGEMISPRKTIKKSAHYLTFQNLQNWEEGKKLGAFIYQIGNQWGPIELRVLDSKIQGGQGDEVLQGGTSYLAPPPNVQKPREWEILLSLRSCEGLFWKPDGSLTIQSEGSLYSIDASKIQEGINNSSVIKSQKKKLISFTPVNNIFTAEPKLVANGINGACISWISNDSFLFLGRDMMVYLWDQGKKESLLYAPISSEFYYCSKSPPNTTKTPPGKLVKTALNK